MNIIVFLKMVPDVVEELKIAENGKFLDNDWLRMKLSESDEHALEEAIILKEKFGGNVTAIALEAPEVDDSLYNALAKGADRVIKITGEWNDLRAPVIAEIYSSFLKNENIIIDDQTLILTGSQSIDDLEGELVYYLAENLDLGSNGVVTSINVFPNEKKVTFMKEFSSGLRGEFDAFLPAILGIQAAEKPPRYIPIAKVRSIMKTSKIEEKAETVAEPCVSLEVDKLFFPEVAGKAEMIEGEPEHISSRITEILIEHGII
jgi:electron transfer flavoprotein beta subunit